VRHRGCAAAEGGEENCGGGGSGRGGGSGEGGARNLNLLEGAASRTILPLRFSLRTAVLYTEIKVKYPTNLLAVSASMAQKDTALAPLQS
jgi:hypothetical protein